MRLFWLVPLFLVACGPDVEVGDRSKAPWKAPTTPDLSPPESTCNLTEDWETASELIQTHCGDCHGTTLKFGAPNTLTELAAFTEDTARDTFIKRLTDGSMPPGGGMPPMTGDSRAALIKWANCGEDDPQAPPINPGGIGADHDILTDDGQPPPNTDFFDLRAGDFKVRPEWSNHYECFTFEAPVDEPRFIRRIETIIDDARVLHHTTLIPEGVRPAGTHGSCADDNPLMLIYAWAPGQGALHFPEGGIRLEPGQQLTLQIHYNNAARHRDVIDNSGVRIYHGPVEGPEVTVLTLGPLGFRVDPRSTADVFGYCKLPADTHLVASFPHMHEAGIGFEQTVKRADGTVESMITLDGWDFNAQYIYETSMDLHEGDLITTRCRYRNLEDEPLRFGPDTEDEMCFNFAYVSPPIDVSFCNQNSEPREGYEPGICAPVGGLTQEPEAVEARFFAGSVPEFAPSEWPSGTWVLTDAAFYLPTFELGGFNLDPEASSIIGYGLAGFVDGEIMLDVLAQVHLVVNTLAFDRVLPISFGGAPIFEAGQTYGNLSATCGAYNDILGYEFDGEAVKLHIKQDFGPVVIDILLTFKPAD